MSNQEINRGYRMLNARDDHARATIQNSGEGMKYLYVFNLLDENGRFVTHKTHYSAVLLADSEISGLVTIPANGAVKVERLYNDTRLEHGNSSAVLNNYVGDVYTLESGSNWQTVPHIYTIAAPIAQSSPIAVPLP